MHGVASQEKQEYSIQDKPAVIYIPAEATPLVAKKVRHKWMAKELNALFSDLKETFTKLRSNPGSQIRIPKLNASNAAFLKGFQNKSSRFQEYLSFPIKV